MAILVHVFLFILPAALIWFFSGILIESVDHIAKRFHKTDFTVAFFVLGFLTSISEISVAFNSTLDKVPQVSVGNLIGASFVILLLIVPFLAVAGNGVTLRHTLSRRNLLVALAIILLPSLLIIDGNLTRTEGVLLLLVYITLLYLIRSKKGPAKELQSITHELVRSRGTAWDVVKIATGAVIIFIAGHYLVEEAVFFANAFTVPQSLIGLTLLSIGTNVPELAIAVRSVLKRREDVAFGDYLGSAVTNVPILGLLPLLNGSFRVEPGEFMATTALMAVGLLCFYIFAGSKDRISRKEGLILLAFYAAFLFLQFLNFARFAGN